MLIHFLYLLLIQDYQKGFNYNEHFNLVIYEHIPFNIYFYFHAQMVYFYIIFLHINVCHNYKQNKYIILSFFIIYTSQMFKILLKLLFFFIYSIFLSTHQSLNQLFYFRLMLILQFKCLLDHLQEMTIQILIYYFEIL